MRGLLAVTLLVLGGARLRAPDLGRWSEGDPAWEAPAVLARIRGHGGIDTVPESTERPERELEEVGARR
jgi:hypothetical protein